MSGSGNGASGGRSFLDGGGELGALMRSHDWHATPLGAPEDWPRSLKTAVRIMLTSRQPFWLGWGPDLTYLYNDAYRSIIGGKHPEALGKPFHEVWREIWDVVGPMAEHVLRNDEGTYVESQLLVMERHGYPEETYYTFSYSPVPDDDGVPRGLICANSDDTHRVIGARQLALLSTLGARQGAARNWADACAKAVEALNTNPHDVAFALIFLHDQGRFELVAHTPGAESLADASLWPCERVAETGRMRLADPPVPASLLPCGAWSRPPVRMALLPLQGSAGRGMAGLLVIGLNPFRKFDEGYASFVELLARQVAAGIANARAYEEERRRAEALAELDRAKTTFFSNVSHEFRTPLTLMLGPLQDVLSKPEGAVPPEARGLLTVVERNGRRLMKLVNTLLDFARIEAGRAQATFEPTDIGRITAELASNFRSACESGGIRLVVDTPTQQEPAFVDRDMWEKIVLNLLSNAFKFTFRGQIAIRLRDEDDRFVLRVADTGVGIPRHELPRMFERFHRVEGTHGRSHEGSGIGLALVQELVRLHGGSIGVESELERGTTFTVSLPKGRAHLPAEHVKEPLREPAASPRAGDFVSEVMSWLADRAPAPSGAHRSVPAPRVILADDNADLREYAGRLLAEHYDVEVVTDGHAALAAARARLPHVIVSDVMMPRLDGFGLIRELRADPALRAIPVILLSARAGNEARIEGLSEGADDYLVKPFNARELLVRVGALVNSAQAHRKAAEALSQFEALFEHAPLGVYLVDDDMRIAAVNPVARPVFGDIPDLIGRDFEQVIRILWPEAYAREIIRQFRHTLQTGEPHHTAEHDEVRVDRQVREIYEWQIHRIPIAGERRGVVCYFRDISPWVAAREALRDADRRKDEFLATLSHELRNPMAPLRNALHVLSLGPASGNAAGAALGIMDRQLRHLVRLVDDLLEVSRINRGTLELRIERVELAEIVRHALETSKPLIEAARHRLRVILPEERVWLDGDPVRLSQILSNLLNNAANYTPPDGEITLRAGTEDHMASLAVRDNGMGLPAAEAERIFEMFNRGPQLPEGGKAGLGIGLPLARRLAQMHGGTVVASSAGPGQGSEFVVRLPIAAVQAAGAVAQLDGDIVGAREKRILIVDDNADAAESLALLLEMFGARTRVARDGLEGLQAFEEFVPDVVLLDIGMPRMDGYEVARTIRAKFSDRGAMLVALTGWGQSEDRRRAQEAGFDRHLLKPVDLSDLKALLESMEEREG